MTNKLVNGVVVALTAAEEAERAAEEAAFTPPPAPPVDARLWLERLPPEKQIAIVTAALAKPALMLWLLKAAGAQNGVALDNPDTNAGVGALVAAGVLTSADQQVLLTPSQD